MQSRIDSLTFALNCPKCGYGTEKTLRWLNHHREFCCPACLATGTIDNEVFQGVREQAARLDQQLRALGKHIMVPA